MDNILQFKRPDQNKIDKGKFIAIEISLEELKKSMDDLSDEDNGKFDGLISSFSDTDLIDVINKCDESKIGKSFYSYYARVVAELKSRGLV